MHRPPLAVLLLAAASLLPCQGLSQAAGPQPSPEAAAPPIPVIQTTVRRVVVDIVVTDRDGNPVPGLHPADFTVKEDGRPQTIASFDVHGFTDGMDYTPAKLPPQPPNTFINLPTTPEKGPLYVLLFDMANMDNSAQQTSENDYSAQMYGRQQLMRFVASKPEGTRFALFVHSDGLHLVEGFTSDRARLVAALNPAHPVPHVPKVFLYGTNYGQGDRYTAVAELRAMAEYLAETPGRKNLIWFACNFPLSLTLNDTLDAPAFQDELKATTNLLAQDQIAVYPVDARGTVVQPVGGGFAIQSSYDAMDQIARNTGGRAFYGSNDVASLLAEASRAGGSYYTLTYAPSNRDSNGASRSITVTLEGKGYTLAYRRSYFALPAPPPVWRTMAEVAARTGPNAASPSGATPNAAAPGKATPDPVEAAVADQALQRPASDTLSVNMQHGAPETHDLVFGVHAQSPGGSRLATPEEMAALATQPAFFHTRRPGRAPKPLPPVPLQTYSLGFRIFTRQFRPGTPLDLEVAAAAYDIDGTLLNALIRTATLPDGVPSATARSAGFFSLDERLAVPSRAAYLRFAVNDVAGHRVGAEEIRLPLAQDPTPAADLGTPHP